MYDEVCQQPGVGVDGVGRPFLSPLVYIRPMDDWLFMGPNRWEMYQHRHTRPQAAALLFGGTGYCHGVENIPVEASGSTQVDSFFSFLHPTLSIVLAISFRHFLASDLALYHIIFYVLYHHHLDEIEEGF
jgi:hypothetical protein